MIPLSLKQNHYFNHYCTVTNNTGTLQHPCLKPSDECYPKANTIIPFQGLNRRAHINFLHKIGLVDLLDTLKIPEYLQQKGLTRTNLVYYLDKAARRFVGIKTIEEHLKNDTKFFTSNLVIKGREQGLNAQVVNYISNKIGNKINTWEDTMRLFVLENKADLQHFIGDQYDHIHNTLINIAKEFDNKRIFIKPINPQGKQYDTEIGVKLHYFLNELENSLPQEKYVVYRELLTNLINAEEAKRIEDAVRHSPKADPHKIIYDLSKLNNTKISVMFTDVVGSTDLWNKVWKKSGNGQDLSIIASFMNQLNQFLKEMGAVMRYCGSTVDKYIGDAIMGYSSNPTDLVKSGIAMREVLTILQKMWQANGLEKIDIRSGIGTGKAILTWVGQQPLNKSVFGPTANLAARIEASTKLAKHNLVVCENTYRELADQLKQQGIQVNIAKAVNYGEAPSVWKQTLHKIGRQKDPNHDFYLKGFDGNHQLYKIDLINTENMVKDYLQHRSKLLGNTQEEQEMTEVMKNFYDNILQERHAKNSSSSSGIKQKQNS